MTRDESADIALRLVELYRRAQEYPDPHRARLRLRAICEAAQDAGVWRLFCAIRDGHLSTNHQLP